VTEHKTSKDVVYELEALLCDIPLRLHGATVRNAIVEIERLTRELVEAKGPTYRIRQAQAEQIDLLEAERDRLRAALEQAYGIWSRYQGDLCKASDDMADVIHKALGRPADEPPQDRNPTKPPGTITFQVSDEEVETVRGMCERTKPDPEDFWVTVESICCEVQARRESERLAASASEGTK
jgi:hypothetical protein